MCKVHSHPNDFRSDTDAYLSLLPMEKDSLFETVFKKRNKASHMIKEEDKMVEIITSIDLPRYVKEKLLQ